MSGGITSSSSFTKLKSAKLPARLRLSHDRESEWYRKCLLTNTIVLQRTGGSTNCRNCADQPDMSVCKSANHILLEL